MHLLDPRAILELPKFESVNLLDRWYQVACEISHPLAIKRTVPREVVDEIKNTLVSFFTPKFFIHKFGENAPIKKIHFVKRLLLQGARLECIHALHELCYVLRHARANHPTIYQNLKAQIAASDQFQATLYEAAIAHQFDRRGIEFKTDQHLNGVPLDGFLIHNAKPVIVECKKLLAPSIDEFDCVRRIADHSVQLLLSNRFSGGFTITMTSPRPVSAGEVTHARLALIECIRQLPVDAPMTVASSIRSGAVVLACYPYGRLDKGASTTQTELAIKIDVGQQYAVGDNTVTPIQIEAEVSYSREIVIDKIVRVIKQARDQHKKMSDRHLVIFLDSQELPDFRFGLLTGSDILADKDVNKEINRARGDATVAITRRTYEVGGGKMTCKFFFTRTNRSLVDHIVKAFSDPPAVPSMLYLPTPKELFKFHQG